MNWLLIIGIIIIVILVIALLMNFIKLALKTLGIVILIALAILAVLGVLTYFDAMDFQETFGISNNLYLLRDNTTIKAGLIVNYAKPEDVQFLEEPALKEYELKLQQEDYEAVLGENYKIFIIEMAVLENSTIKSFKIENFNISKEFALGLLKSNTPRDDLANYQSVETNVPKDLVLQQLTENKITSDAVLKDQIFGLFMANEFSKENAIKMMISNIKTSKVYVYPKKFLFTMIRLIPDKWIDQVMDIKAEGEE